MVLKKISREYTPFTLICFGIILIVVLVLLGYVKILSQYGRFSPAFGYSMLVLVMLSARLIYSLYCFLQESKYDCIELEARRVRLLKSNFATLEFELPGELVEVWIDQGNTHAKLIGRNGKIALSSASFENSEVFSDYFLNQWIEAGNKTWRNLSGGE